MSPHIAQGGSVRQANELRRKALSPEIFTNKKSISAVSQSVRRPAIYSRCANEPESAPNPDASEPNQRGRAYSVSAERKICCQVGGFPPKFRGFSIGAGKFGGYINAGNFFRRINFYQ